MLSDASIHGNCKLSLTCRRPDPNPTPATPVSKYRGYFSLQMMAFTFSYGSWYMLFHVQSSFADVNFHSASLTFVVAGKNLPK